MNKELIMRLSKYKRLLHKFKALGLERVFSNNLGDAIGVTPALVRKDFSVLTLPETNGAGTISMKYWNASTTSWVWIGKNR